MTSAFNRMASLITAKELQRPFGGYYRDTLITAENDQGLPMWEDEGDYCIVTNDEGNNVGVIYLPDFQIDASCGDYDGKRLSEICDSIDPNHIISSNTTALRIAEVFTEKDADLLLVIDGDRITGTIKYEDLYQMEFIMCLFVMTLSFEEAALQMIRVQAKGPDWWKCLPPNRQENTLKLYKRRYNKSLEGCKELPYDDLLECMTCCDKQKIIHKLNLLKEFKRSEIDTIFSRVERMRNDCAHAVSEKRRASFNIKRDELGVMIKKVHEFTQLMEQRGIKAF